MGQFGTPTDKPAAQQRTNALLSLVLMILALVLAWPVGASAFISADGGGSPRQGAGTSATLRGVAFTDTTHGWAVGDCGTILATTNGGATWKEQSSKTAATLVGVAFTDATHGWAVGVNGEVFVTANGGGAWSRQRSGHREDTYDIAFSDDSHGWIVGWNWDTEGALILATTDGGATWKKQNPGSAAQLFGAAFSDATHGWAVGARGYHGVVLATTDGGATWVDQTTNVVLTTPRAWMWALGGVACIDALHAWVAGGPWIFATSDGGATWNEQTAREGGAGVGGLVFADASHGWAVGGLTSDSTTNFVEAYVLATTDGGATWSRQPTGANAGLAAVAFPDAVHGWAVGGFGTILATTDGGATWSGQPAGSSKPKIGLLNPVSGNAHGKRGAVVTISGINFGKTRGTSSVRFGSESSASYPFWSADWLKCKVPMTAEYGMVKVTVTTAAGTSNALSFTVTQ